MYHKKIDVLLFDNANKVVVKYKYDNILQLFTILYIFQHRCGMIPRMRGKIGGNWGKSLYFVYCFLCLYHNLYHKILTVFRRAGCLFKTPEKCAQITDWFKDEGFILATCLFYPLVKENAGNNQ